MISSEDAEHKILYCVQKLVDVIIHSRNCFPSQSIAPESKSKENTEEYVRHHLMHKWKHDFYSTLILNVYVKEGNCDNPDLRLLEKWSFQCLRGGSEAVNNRSGFSRRIGILIRSLYCYVRLLPAFHLSVRSRSSFVFQIDCNELSDGIKSIMLPNEFMFPRLPSPTLGYLVVKVAYVGVDAFAQAPKITLAELNRSDHATGLSPPSPSIGSPGRNSSLPMPIPDTSNGNRLRSMSIGNNVGNVMGLSGERPRSLDSNPLFLQEAYLNHLQQDSSSSRRDFGYSPASISPIGITPPFSSGLLSRTPETYALTSTSSTAASRQRDGLPPLPSAVNLLSTSPQQIAPIIDISMIRNKFFPIQQANRLGVELSSRSLEGELNLSSLPLSPFDAIAENSSSLSKQDSSARSRQGSFDINRPRSSGDGDMLILLSDEVSGDMKDDDEEDVFKFEEDIPFACDDTAILDNVSLISSKFETEKQGLFKYNDHLADPPVLQSIMVRGVDGKPRTKSTEESDITLIQQYKEFHLSFSD